ncbi:MAG: hypothetical protein HC787_01030 [Nostocaceae cyanobacterium CSU_2_110]|nr:hypothetical protein [Nostocaceae cyanobacterium CSU_2_110]
MSDKNHSSLSKNISFQEVLMLVSSLFMAKTGKHLSNIEVLVLGGSWKGQKYNQIAAEGGYTEEYIKNDVGPKLWKRLSQALEKKLTKLILKQFLNSRFMRQKKEK